MKLGRLEAVIGHFAAAGAPGKAILGESAVNVFARTEMARLDDPRIELPAHLAGELAGDGTAGNVNELFRQHHRRGQVISARHHASGNRGHRRPIGRTRLVRIEAGRQIGPAGHDGEMAGRVRVVRMGQRADQRPFAAAPGQHRQVFADVHAGSLRRRYAELTANAVGGIGFRIEAVELRQAA